MDYVKSTRCQGLATRRVTGARDEEHPDSRASPCSGSSRLVDCIQTVVTETSLPGRAWGQKKAHYHSINLPTVR